MDWKPWVDYSKEIDILPITEPPCKECLNFKPVRQYAGTRFDGVRICHASEMQNDFSCYRKLDKPANE